MKKSIWWILSLFIATGMTACGGDDKDKKEEDNNHNQPATTIVENTRDLCSDNLDNDNNGLADCKDSGCKDFAFCQEAEDGKENTLAACMDGEDNDGDGAKDCDDTECKAFAICQDSEPENTLATCQDGKDNDKDGLIDCSDPECKEFNVCNTNTDPGTDTPEKKTENSPNDCLDGEDNDGDGKTDCCDEGCKVFAFCANACADDIPEPEEPSENTLEACTDGEDNDKDGDVDCLDMDCRGYQICADLTGIAENTRELCSDDIDNDYNGVKDKDDPNCKLFYAAGGQYGENSAAKCKDGNDNDGDGVKDCEDPECQVYDFCMEGYKSDNDECTNDDFKFKKSDKCNCGETLVGDDCYTNIATPSDFSKMSNSTGKYILKQNIDFGKTDREPILSFKGILDGNNKRITGVFNQTSKLYSSSYYCGLFAAAGNSTNPATFKNIDIAITLNCDNKEHPEFSLYAGAIVGSFFGTATNITGSSKVYVDESVNKDTASSATGRINKYIGGLFGGAVNADLSDITISGNVSGYLYNEKYDTTNTTKELYIYVGGAAGSAKSLTSIQANNYVTLRRKGNITSYATFDFVGGVAGNVSGDVQNVSNQGVVKFLPIDTNRNYSYLGGVVAQVWGGNVKDSSFTGLIETNNVKAASYYNDIGGIVGRISQTTSGETPDTNIYGIDHCQTNATFRVVSSDTRTGGIIGYTDRDGRYIRNCSSVVDFELLTPTTSSQSAYYGGIAGYTGLSSNTYIVNNSSRTNYIQSETLTEKDKNIGGITSLYGIVVNNFASDTLSCPESGCRFTPKAIGGSYIYESYWNKELFGDESGAVYYSDASAEPYTYTITGVPIVRNTKTVLGLLRYNSAHDGGVLSAHIPANDDDHGGMIYHDWTVEIDKDGHEFPVPADK